MTILESNLNAQAKKIYSKAGPVLLQIVHAMPWSAWFLLIGLVVFLWFWIFGTKGLYEMEQLRGVRQELTQEKTKLVEEKKQLEQELQYLKDPEYQQYIIRRELGYIKEDEVLIQFPNTK